ncbi:MAG: CorA family divalent cation transporter [Candidatus Paceibacterota bacterium]|jgi:magnesium transporter
MINRHLYNGISWIDVENPDRDDVKTLINEYDIDPLVCQELLAPTMRPKVDLYKTYFYLVLHFPTINKSNGAPVNQEIDFILGKDFLITAHYNNIETLDMFAKVFEVKATLNKKDLGSHAGYVFFNMIKALYEKMVDELDIINDKIEEIEDDVFDGKEREMVEELSHVSRYLLDFKKALALHHEILSSLQFVTQKIFEPAFQYYVRAIEGEYLKVESSIISNRDSVKELRETNNTLLQTKVNEVMKKFNILAFVTFPLSLVAAIMSLESSGNPFKNGTINFWPIVFMFGFVVVGMIIYFKHKKWL